MMTTDWTDEWVTNLLKYFHEEDRFPTEEELSVIHNRVMFDFTAEQQWGVILDLLVFGLFAHKLYNMVNDHNNEIYGQVMALGGAE